MHWNGWHMGGWMGLGWLLVIAAVVVVVWVTLGARRVGRGEESSPQQVLARRYANGEIDRETYRRMLQDLST